jgi:FAD/FMN-containing dehydrogenase
MTAVAEPGLEALASELTGPVVLRGSPEWLHEIAGFNVAHQHTPDLVVGAATAEDVQLAMRYAVNAGLPIAVQATGHGAVAPVDRGLLVTTRRMESLTIDPSARTATVGAGVRWRVVIDAAGEHGLAPLNGSTSDVGVVGYTLGGGLPVLGRAFGFAADHVRSLRVVTPDGRLREVDAEHEPDLFWGLRGGKGNLGIVTELTVDLFPIRTVYGGGIFYPEEQLPAVVAAYRGWSAGLPDAFCTSLAVLRLPPRPEIPEQLRGRTVGHLRVCYLGPSTGGDTLVAPMREIGPAVLDTVGEMPYLAVDSIHQDPEHPLPFYERSLLLRELTDEAADALLAEVGPGVPSPILMCEIRQLGGALRRRPAVPNAVSGRDAAYSVLAVAVLAPEIAEAGPPAVDALMDRLTPWSTGQTLLNLHGRPGDEADRARAWDPATYQRLRALRAAFDPTGVLAYGHVITE